jgi:integrase
MASVYRPHGKLSYRFAFLDQNRRRRTAGGYRDKAATEALARKVEQDAARMHAGLEPLHGDLTLPILTGQTPAQRRPLQEIIDRYIRSLDDQGRGQRHQKESRRLLETVARQCKWTYLGDIQQDSLKQWLDTLKDAGRAPRTLNSYRDAVVALVNWCMEQKPKLLYHSPMDKQKYRAEGNQPSKPRRAYTPEELQRLLAATRSHRLIYQVAALSGLRKSELRQLERRDCTPTGPAPTWHLRPQIDKSRRRNVVPMLPEAAELLAPIWLKLPPTGRLFRRIPRTQTLNNDIKRAKIAKLDAEGRTVDFHSLRYYFCTEMARRLPLAKVRELMRHRDIRTTMNLYADLGLQDLAQDVQQLPRLLDAPQKQQDSDAGHAG